MRLQATCDIRIRVNGEKENLTTKQIVEVKDNDVDQINFLKMHGFVEVKQLQTTDASTKEIVKAKGKKPL